MTQLTPDHVVAVCQYLITEAETAASDHRALSSRSGSARKTLQRAAEQWDARAVWIRETQSHMTAQLERSEAASSAA